LQHGISENSNECTHSPRAAVLTLVWCLGLLLVCWFQVRNSAAVDMSALHYHSNKLLVSNLILCNCSTTAVASAKLAMHKLSIAATSTASQHSKSHTSVKIQQPHSSRVVAARWFPRGSLSSRPRCELSRLALLQISAPICTWQQPAEHWQQRC
jgi:hypothetical protein